MKDTKLEKFAVVEQKRQFRLTTIALGGLVAAYIVFVVFRYLFGGSQSLPVLQPEDVLENETFAEGITETLLMNDEEVLVDVGSEEL